MKILTPVVSLCLVAILVGSSLLWAQPPIGSEFQVNTYTFGSQGGTAYSASNQKDVAFAEGQGFVVVWQDSGHSDTGNINGQDGSLGGIIGQRFSAAAEKIGNEFQVNTVTAGNQGDPAIYMNGSGEFVVVWSSYLRVGYNYTWGIHGQRFGAQGDPNGLEFNVATIASNFGGLPRLAYPDVAMAENSPFVVTWQASDGDLPPATATDALARRYDANGVPQGVPFFVSADAQGNQDTPRVAMDSDGDFVVAWTDRPPIEDGAGIPTSSYPGILAQRFAADGSRTGAELQVNSYTPGNHRAPSVGAGSDGSFVVSWWDRGYAGYYPDYNPVGRFGVFAQRFDSGGNAIGSDIGIDSIPYGSSGSGVAGYGASTTGSSDIAVEATGNFIVTWAFLASFGNDTSYESIQARSFGADGEPWGPEIQVNTYTTGPQNRPAVAGSASDKFVVVWDDAWASYSGSVDGQDGSLSGTFGQIFGSAQIFADGFESGDNSSWSSISP